MQAMDIAGESISCDIADAAFGETRQGELNSNEQNTEGPDCGFACLLCTSVRG